LQGFWRLDETNTGPRLDSSPALSNTLTNVGGVGWSTAGVVGNASLLNNNAYTATQYLKIEDGQSSGLNFRNSFTLVGWLKRERLGEDMILVSKYEWGLSQRAYRLQLTPGDRLRLVVSPNGATYDSNVYLTGPTLLTSTTAWYHVAAVFDAANKRLKLYLNGNLEATKAVSYDMVFLSDAPFMLGANLVNTTAVQPFDGQLDEWRVYNRVLGKNEIQALMSE
jgi:hypothetical protein